VNGSLRRTIITRPAGDAAHPAVLYVTGIGCFSQESLGVRSTEAKLLHVIESFHPGHATLSMIPGMDHYLTREPSMKASMEKTAAGEFEPRVLETIQGWLTRQAAG